MGYTPDEVMGKKLVREFITDEFKTAVQAVLDQALHGEETANFEFPLMTKAGARLEVLLNATTRRDEQGKVIGVVGIGQDITGRIAQEREYSKLIDTANAPIFGVNTLGRVNVWNQCARKLVGYAPEEVMGHSLVQEFITPEHRARVQSVIDQALAGEETANFEFPLMTKAGARLEVLLNATTRRDEQGNVIGVVGIGQDITGRLAQEREYTPEIKTDIDYVDTDLRLIEGSAADSSILRQKIREAIVDAFYSKPTDQVPSNEHLSLELVKRVGSRLSFSLCLFLRNHLVARDLYWKQGTYGNNCKYNNSDHGLPDHAKQNGLGYEYCLGCLHRTDGHPDPWLGHG